MNDATTETRPAEAGLSSGLSGFLVLGRCGCDDVPMRLCATAGEAAAAAAALTVDDVREVGNRLFGATSGLASYVWTVEFRRGRPLDECLPIRELEEES
jgi:hypothetical protein